MLLCWWTLLGCVWADGNRLQQLLVQQQVGYAPACITSGFYDTRGVSRYRSQPGLHLGYDIAMPYGAPVRAAWAGVVVALVPWTDSEWGVTVRHVDGSQATYGHVFPLLKVGTPVEVGTVLARIASDHVDVKMRDAQGNPFDFGAGGGLTVPVAHPRLGEQIRQAHTDLLGALRKWPPREAQGVVVSASQRAEIARLGLWTEKRLAAAAISPTKEPDWPELVEKYVRLKRRWTGPDLQLEGPSPADLDRLQRGAEAAQRNWLKHQRGFASGLFSQRQMDVARTQWRQWQAVEKALKAALQG